MLSLLLTAFLLFCALLAGLRLRSIARAAAVFVLAAAAFALLARRPFEGLADGGIHVVYEVDAERANEPGPDLPERAAAVAARRLETLGLSDVSAAAAGGAVDLRFRGRPEALAEAKRVLGTVGLLELAEVDDEKDFFRPLEIDEETGRQGIRLKVENVPAGPGRTVPRYFAFLALREGESSRDTLQRLRAWAGTLQVPAGRRIAFEQISTYDPDADTWEIAGWRTFLLASDVLLTNRHVRAAHARQDDSGHSFSQWVVDLELTPEGGSLFEEATGRLIKRRIAIVLDGVVQSAPVIQSRISGGRAVITMGEGSIEEQETNARNLQGVLRAGALPAPLLLASEEHLPARLSALVVAALTAAAGLLLCGAVVVGLVLVLRRPSGKQPAAQAPLSRSD